MESIIGFDLGHGETALTYIEDAMSKRGETGVHPIPVFRPVTQPTIYAENDGEPTWGEEALRICNNNNPLTHFEIAFKDKPKNISQETRTIMQKYAVHVSSRACESVHCLGQGENIIWIGCPSGWEDGDMDAYKNLFDDEGMTKLFVCKESRAAFAHHYNLNPNNFKLGSVDNGVLVLDFGSSTIDATLAVGLNDNIVHPGQPYGASWFDKALLLWTMKNWDDNSKCTKKEILTILGKPSCLFSAEYAARKSKENFYNEGGYSTWNVRFYEEKFKIFGVSYGDFCFDTSAMKEILSTPLNQIIAQLDSTYYDEFEQWCKQSDEHNGYPVLEFRPVPRETRDAIGSMSWLELNRLFLESCKSALVTNKDFNTDKQLKIIMTGGVSQMQEIRDMVADVLGDYGEVIPDSEPSKSVSSGLACWGRIEYQTRKFEQEIEELLFGKDDDENHTGILLNVINEQMKEANFEDIIVDEFHTILVDELNKYWKREQSGSAAKHNLKRRYKSWVESSKYKERIEKESRRVQENINRDLDEKIKPIMEKYDLTDVSLVSGLYFSDVMTAICDVLSGQLVDLIDEFEALDSLGERPGFLGGLFSNTPDIEDIQEFINSLVSHIYKGTLKFIYGDEDAATAIIGSLYWGYKESIDQRVTATRYMIIGND